jgi:hypothetical protein
MVIGSPIGRAAFNKRYFDLDWTERMRHSRAPTHILGDTTFGDRSDSAIRRFESAAPSQSDLVLSVL